MFYDAVKNNHGLPHDPFKALIAPRPIGWISSLDADGVVNLAPYSFFNGMASNPHYVCFGSQGRKDSQSNIETTGEFVCNLAVWDLRDQMNATSASVPASIDEMKIAGLTPAPCQFVKPLRVAESPAAFECVHFQTVELEGDDGGPHDYAIVIGKVLGVHINDNYITEDGLFDTAKAMPIARGGYHDYSVVNKENSFSMTRPDLTAETFAE
ncbi:MAG: flavin reductase family protein [Hyphomicrobiales bacterium]